MIAVISHRGAGPHANCYVTKPIDFRQFLGIVRAIEEFWLTEVKLPPSGRA